MTVAQLLRTMSSAELTEWRAYARVSPFGEWRADYRNAITAQTVAAAAGVKRTKTVDFMPDFTPKEPQTMEEQKSIMAGIAKAWGGGRG